MMRSLQAKLTFAMLLTSLTSVALVGLVARGMLHNKFDQIAMEQSLIKFRGMLQAYIGKHGSWEKAQQTQDFRDFVRQKRLETGNTTSAPQQNPTLPLEPQFATPLQTLRPNDERQADDQEPATAPPGEASFRFIVLAADGKVVMGPPEMRGQLAPEHLRAQAEPVIVNGQTAAYVVPFGEPNYTQQDRIYIGAMNQALMRGVFAATVLAVALGLYFGKRLSRRLRHLTGAIEAMSEGELRQEVMVEANDEVGVLAGAFNRMSAELAAAHEKLQESHAKISRQAQMLKELAVRDGLTKLHNRRFFDERGAHAFAQAKRYNRPLTVMIGDIDFFKRINDSFSHAIGDEVLRHVAAILQKNTRETDIVARYGGEEFVIAFPETDLLQALALCERLRLQIESYGWHTIHPNLRVTMSMGLNQDLTLESFEKLVAAADTRLYTAKETGRNRVCAPVGV